MLSNVEKPPEGIKESCIPLTAPFMVAVVITDHSAVCAQPNLTSLPSKLGSCSNPKLEFTIGFPWNSPAAVIQTKARKKINSIQNSRQACLILLENAP